MKISQSKGFTLIECMISVGIASILFISSLGLLSYARLSNQVEQERARAHQIVSQRIEAEDFRLWTHSRADEIKTIWDNRTPDDPSDDTIGYLDVNVIEPKTGTIVTSQSIPNPATLLQVEVTLTWHPGGPLSSKTFRETVMGYKAP